MRESKGWGRGGRREGRTEHAYFKITLSQELSRATGEPNCPFHGAWPHKCFHWAHFLEVPSPSSSPHWRPYSQSVNAGRQPSPSHSRPDPLWAGGSLAMAQPEPAAGGPAAACPWGLQRVFPQSWKEQAGYGGQSRAQGPGLQPVRKKQGTIEPTSHCVKLPFLTDTRTRR